MILCLLIKGRGNDFRTNGVIVLTHAIDAVFEIRHFLRPFIDEQNK